MKTVAIIPARYASTRFPGKPLANQSGKFLIQHVYEQVRQARSIDEVMVATDDHRIVDAVESFGGRAVMTREDHPSGTDRVAEVARTLHADIIVNVQGDEPEIAPSNIDTLVDCLSQSSDVLIATLACPFAADDDPSDPNAVKVVLDQRGRALFFSRSVLPYPRSQQGKPDRPGDWLLHLGIYAYRRDFLLQIADMPPAPLEQCEHLEQLRVLEHGHPIAVAIVEQAAVGIDTPEDYAAFLRRLASSAN